MGVLGLAVKAAKKAAKTANVPPRAEREAAAAAFAAKSAVRNPDGTPRLTGGGALISSLGREGIVTAFYGNPRQVFATLTAKF